MDDDMRVRSLERQVQYLLDAVSRIAARTTGGEAYQTFVFATIATGETLTRGGTCTVNPVHFVGYEQASAAAYKRTELEFTFRDVGAPSDTTPQPFTGGMITTGKELEEGTAVWGLLMGNFAILVGFDCDGLVDV